MLFDIKEFIPTGRTERANEPIDGEKARKAWKSVHAAEARCDFAPDKYRLNSRGILFLSLWKASLYGMTLSDIKADADMPEFFAKNFSDFIGRFLNISGNSETSILSENSWCIVTPPPRRHLFENFTERVANLISRNIGIPFIPRIAECKNRQRVNAEFNLLKVPDQKNIICFDDIVTTGSTFIAMDKLLRPLGKTVIFMTAINNKL